MNIQKMQKVLAIILMVMILISTVSTIVMAVEPKNITADPSVSSESIETAGKKVVAVLQTIGFVISVVVLIVIGIKYMMGSAEEKAEYKKTFIPYIVGAALIFAASIFAQAAYEFFSGWNG